MAITQEIDLNLIPSSAPVIVHLNQYDEGKGRIIAHLYNGSNPYVPGVNATVKVQGTKPDKHAFQYWCDIDGSTVTVDVNVQMTAVAGLVPTQLIVNETSGITGSFAFQLDVQASTLPSNIDVSETDLPILTEEAQEAARRAVQAAASAEESAEEAAAWSANPPYIGENLHWFVYDTETEQFVDSGVIAEGQDGEPGNKWYKGTTISGESSTPTVFPSSGIALAYHNDFYLNATEGSIYHCETPGDASTATWVYDFRLSGGGGGVTNYNDLTNKPKIGGVELTGNKTIADLGGVLSFNGRSGSILPIAGDYKSNQIILSSIMHIGGGTQDDVQEALEALVDEGGAGHTILNGLGQEMPQRKNLRFAGADLSDDAQNDTTNVTITGGSGGSTITVTTIETTLYGETVTITDGTSTFTGVFDNSGVCVIDGVTATGTLTVTSGAASRTLSAPYFGNYTVVLSFWAATINVSTDPDVVSAIVKKDGVQIDTISFSAGSGVYVADSTGAYAFTATVGGIDFTSPTVNVTQQTTYNTTIDIFSAALSISTSSSELYGKTITIKKGSTVVGTTAFSAQGSATYTVHETGTYTCECEGYSGSATVSAETTYNVTIDTIITYHLTVDIYSAASDTLSYTDDNGAQTVTTDATGKATGVSIDITQPSAGVDPSITFTSSIAKDPNNLSNDYSKTVTITENMTDIYVMPDGNVLYWYGYQSPDLEIASTANGWTIAGYSDFSFSNPTFNNYSITFSPSGEKNFQGVGSKTKVDASQITAIYKATGSNSDSSWAIGADTKDVNSAAVLPQVTPTQSNVMEKIVSSGTMSNVYVKYIALRPAGAGILYALWYE